MINILAIFVKLFHRERHLRIKKVRWSEDCSTVISSPNYFFTEENNLTPSPMNFGTLMNYTGRGR